LIWIQPQSKTYDEIHSGRTTENEKYYYCDNANNHRQGQFLAFILRYTERYGRSPSFDDMAAHFGITSPSVNGMIKTLERKALISRIPGGARTLRVEVPVGSLPAIDFDRDKSRKTTKSKLEASAPALAAFTAIAVWTQSCPCFKSWRLPRRSECAVLKSAQRIGESLARTGHRPKTFLRFGDRSLLRFPAGNLTGVV